MVGEDYYEEAKKLVFYDADMEKYADFIELIDDYHYNVQVPAEEVVKRQYEEQGIQYFNITKYGVQSIPVTSNSDELSDSFVDIPGASLGATVGTISKDLSDEYIVSAVQNGRSQYISPDKKVDAATCIYPERTWFIKNLEHEYFPDSVNCLMVEMINNPEFDIHSNAKYPQYLVYEKDTLEIVPTSPT
jgi:hypothetical protein